MMETIHDLDPDNSTYEEKRHMNSLLAEEIKRQDEIISKHISENYTTTKEERPLPDYTPDYTIDPFIEDIRRQNYIQHIEYERKQAMQKSKEKFISEQLEQMIELSDGVFYDMDTAYVVMKYDTYKTLRDSKNKLGLRIDNDAAVRLIIDAYVNVVDAITFVSLLIFIASLFLDLSRMVTLASISIYAIGSFLPTNSEKLYDVFLKPDRKKSSE